MIDGGERHYHTAKMADTPYPKREDACLAAFLADQGCFVEHPAQSAQLREYHLSELGNSHTGKPSNGATMLAHGWEDGSGVVVLRALKL